MILLKQTVYQNFKHIQYIVPQKYFYRQAHIKTNNDKIPHLSPFDLVYKKHRIKIAKHFLSE